MLCMCPLVLCRGKGGQQMGFNRAVCGDWNTSAGVGWAASLPGGRRINVTFARLPALPERNSDFSVAVEGS